jgi:hypothetical protein
LSDFPAPDFPASDFSASDFSGADSTASILPVADFPVAAISPGVCTITKHTLQNLPCSGASRSGNYTCQNGKSMNQK